MAKRTKMIALLVGLAVTVAIASVWVQGTIAAQASLPADVGDLSNASTAEIKDNSGAVALRGHFVEIPEDDATPIFRARSAIATTGERL